LIYASLRVTEAWLSSAEWALHAFNGPPDNFIPGCFSDPGAQGPAIGKYKALFEPQNTPFKNKGRGVSGVRRLWCYLIRQPTTQKVFIKFIFGRKSKKPLLAAPDDTLSQVAGVGGEGPGFMGLGAGAAALAPALVGAGADALAAGAAGTYHEARKEQMRRMVDPVKVIHKEHDAITAFCINKVSFSICPLDHLNNRLGINHTLSLSGAEEGREVEQRESSG